MTPAPTHSIIILTKDRPGLLPRAVASALAAMGEDGEILVVDDASVLPAREVLSGLYAAPLRILRRDVSCGISAARNAGIEASRGPVIFFLDDDDVLAPDYVRTILDGPARAFDFGFAACAIAVDGGRPTPERPRFPTGPIPDAAPLRKKLCGTGMGFWIRREVAVEAGPFATDLPINEDTDYVCRLIARGRRAWYSASPGVTVHHHAGPRNLPNVTHRLSASERARAMLLVCNRFPSMASHLGRSFLRHCAKAGLHEEAIRYLHSLSDPRLRLSLSVYFRMKRLGYWLSGASG
ncbi:glycosyltransferase family 2 protein [Tabrizicola sp.]|uniref:glycosyltransferase family 2 protein n=1 Tax=Tabrizicola sp. TaxID=2005166 RepID=UPI0035ADBC3C